jgi:hypothetical protein
MEITLWRRMLDHKQIKQNVPKTEPRMDIPDAYMVDPFLVHQISKGMLTLPRMHETLKGSTHMGTVTSLRNESDDRPACEVVTSKTKACAGRKTIGCQ